PFQFILPRFSRRRLSLRQLLGSLRIHDRNLRSFQRGLFHLGSRPRHSQGGLGFIDAGGKDLLVNLRNWLPSFYGVVEINEYLRNSPRQLRAHIDANDRLDSAAGLHQSRNVAAFDWGGEEGRDRALLAIGVAEPENECAKQNCYEEAHVAAILITN